MNSPYDGLERSWVGKVRNGIRVDYKIKVRRLRIKHVSGILVCEIRAWWIVSNNITIPT